MKSYYIRRLAPWLAFAMTVEIVFTAVTMVQDYKLIDFNVFELVKTFSVLLLTTFISWLYMMIPYMLYLLVLPVSKQNSRLDRIVTLGGFTIFVFMGLFEEVASIVFWEEFQAAFNFIAVDYLVYTNEVIANLYQSYPVNAILAGIAAVTALIVWKMRRVLLTELPAPRFLNRLGQTIFYLAALVLSYYAVDMSRLELNRSYYNNEVAKEGTYSLFSAFLKNELPYETFYLTGDKKENLQILQQKLPGSYAEPDKNLTRRVTSHRAENRANVIVVLMESMSAEFMDENRPAAAPKITPNLTRLSKEGLYFSHTYATGTRSVRGIEALTLGVPPLPGMSIVRRQNNENLHNIGSIFKAKGYENKWIYGGFGYFDNMNYFFGHNGFEVVDRKAWEKGEVTFANAWGACDEDTFAKVIREADKSYAKNKPFFTTLLTISNHRPYSYPDGRIDLPSIKARREGGVKYADYAIGQFLENAKTKPWFDNTVFVFVADHTAGAAGDEEINLEGHHIPLIIYAPKLLKPLRIDTPISQLDVLPTLLGILNFDYESRFYGQDALSPDYQPRFFVSNYQKIGYVKDGVNVILKPVKQYSAEPRDADDDIVRANLREAIAFYHQASDWAANLKEKP